MSQSSPAVGVRKIILHCFPLVIKECLYILSYQCQTMLKVFHGLLFINYITA